MRRFLQILESISNTITLGDLYDEEVLYDEEEAIYHHIDHDSLDVPLTVKTAEVAFARQFMTARGDMTVEEAFLDFAEDWQHELVADKIDQWSGDEIIVTEDGKVIDGNHTLIAAIKSGRPVRYVDLSDL